jgi:small subunit ribosomal protein S9
MAAKKIKQDSNEAKKDYTFTTGKRRKAVASATIKPGKGIIKINTIPLGTITNIFVRMKIEEPLILAGDSWKQYDINVKSHGGGILGQADAARLAIAKGLSELLGPDMRKRFMDYDRNMLIADPRRTETHKPPRSSQGPRRYKQRSKR